MIFFNTVHTFGQDKVTWMAEATVDGRTYVAYADTKPEAEADIRHALAAELFHRVCRDCGVSYTYHWPPINDEEGDDTFCIECI